MNVMTVRETIQRDRLIRSITRVDAITSADDRRVRIDRAAIIDAGGDLPSFRPVAPWGDTGHGTAGAFIDVNARYNR